MRAAMNDLDRAIIAVRKSRAAMPEFMRQLGEGKLWFLVPYHPELEEIPIEITEGMDLPFAQLKDDKSEFVPMFSSFERAREGMKRARFPGRTFSAGSMPAKQALALLAKLEYRAVLNFQCCTTQELGLSPALMSDVADGSALAPDTGPLVPQEASVKVLDPADYPTNLMQPTFELLRKHPNFRAAWIFERHEEEPSAEAGHVYHFILLMAPRDMVIFNDLKIVVQAALTVGDDARIVCVDENETALLATLWQQAAPFYTAPDYVRPPDAKGESGDV